MIQCIATTSCVERGFCHVVQAGLELLTSSDLLTSASQSAGIIRLCECLALLLAYKLQAMETRSLIQFSVFMAAPSTAVRNI
ncbi:Protein GVQW1 [Plecturocebus cupreus]